MRVHVPELQSSGVSWAKAIEMSMAESKAGSSVVVLPINKLPNLLNGIDSFLHGLGMVLSDELRVVQVGYEGHPVQGFALHEGRYSCSMRRGTTCESIGSFVKLVENLEKFQSLEGDVLLMYFCTKLMNGNEEV